MHQRSFIIALSKTAISSFLLIYMNETGKGKNWNYFHVFTLLSDCLKCFTITGKTEQTNDVDVKAGQVEKQKRDCSSPLASSNWEISSSAQWMTVI